MSGIFRATSNNILQGRRIALLTLCTLALSGCFGTKEHHALGLIEKDRYLAKSPVSETIKDLLVKEGQSIKRGDIIAQLDSTQAQLDVDEALAQRALAQAKHAELVAGPRPEEIAKARASVDGATAALTEARKAFQRTKSLVSKGMQGKADLDSARSSKERCESALEEAEQYLALLLAGTREEQLRQADASVAQANARVEKTQNTLEDYAITSPIDGVVDALVWHLGERVKAGDPIAVILSHDNAYARVYVPEPKRLALQVGNDVDVRVDGANDIFRGQIRWIASEPAFTPYFALTENDRTRLMYEMEVSLPNAQPLPVGLPAQVILP
ncbi:HlyD family efflux transporter periplasmic adaptor subunit [Enterovibrio sp. ZSDZ35]|uniref:HlyD family efflux transporter periplasmic adaptor subunit n=1 Tax=Enterovibrio qingdaonensis TaxID=2899818 RepID=A0ABT5QGQ7_9GAMM|nr:HlyD family efflux transporter periplasmic adaptor subunit [Enterovibrio sp. ZSDZ35]MDD1780161.1 HlyD family efflux transporter periplasmic adaptor subunit [Enterovibrio sp. ZSDZ35]